MNIEECCASGVINGHAYVDLGLSVLWATCNVGTRRPEGYGSHYAWGEPRTKTTYTEEDSVTLCMQLGNIAGDPQYDAARANWGGTWRLPTRAEIDELINNCERERTTLYGVKGYKFTGPNGNSIFLPAAGVRVGAELYDAGDFGCYWSATPYVDNTGGAYAFSFRCSDGFVGDWDSRFYGCSVRAVTAVTE